MTHTQTAAPAATVPTVAPAAPAPSSQLQAAGQTAMQTGPMTVPSMAMQPPQMAEGGEITASNSNDSNDSVGQWGQWVAIGLISLTLVSLILQIAVHRANLKKRGADDDSIRKDLREVKTNVVKLMGDKYETLG